jgi:predicted DNA-binding transcriptional regulator AlpA
MSNTVVRMLTQRQVAELFNVSTRTILNWWRAGLFPRPLMISPKKRLWDATVIEAFRLAKIEEANNAEANPAR